MNAPHKGTGAAIFGPSQIGSFPPPPTSMSRKWNCYDNAPIESFWGILKNELVHHRRYATRAEAIREIREYIEIFYNRQRRQARLGYLSPAAYGKKFYAERLAAKKDWCLLLTSDLTQRGQPALPKSNRE